MAQFFLLLVKMSGNCQVKLIHHLGDLSVNLAVTRSDHPIRGSNGNGPSVAGDLCSLDCIFMQCWHLNITCLHNFSGNCGCTCLDQSINYSIMPQECQMAISYIIIDSLLPSRPPPFSPSLLATKKTSFIGCFLSNKVHFIS